jgi:hypothetical protein
MAFCDILGLYEYWQDYPPVHEILRCAYRIERHAEAVEARSGSDPSGIGALVARFPDGFVREA